MLEFRASLQASSNYAPGHVPPFALATESDTGEPAPHANTDPQAHQLTEITQTMIEEYRELEPLHKRFEQIKEILKAALGDGVPVQAGAHGVELDIRHQTYLTAAHIISQLGLTDAEVKQLRASAPSRPMRFLRVW
jgi:hypothetical protein